MSGLIVEPEVLWVFVVGAFMANAKGRLVDDLRYHLGVEQARARDVQRCHAPA